MRKALVTLLAAAATATAFVAPASAAASTVVPFAPTHAVTSHAHVRGFNINGYNWGGYAATGSGFTSVSATWVQPSVSCGSTNNLYAPWVGLDGYGSSTVEQTGVATDCSSGHAVNEPWYEMYPANPVYLNTGTYGVNAGDTISASVVYSGSNVFTLTLRDVSRGWTFTTKKTLRNAHRSSAEVIIESPTGSYPNFGTIHFSSATVNGSTLGSFGPVAMDPSSGGIYEAHTGALTGGNAFPITFQHA